MALPEGGFFPNDHVCSDVGLGLSSPSLYRLGLGRFWVTCRGMWAFLLVSPPSSLLSWVCPCSGHGALKAPVFGPRRLAAVRAPSSGLGLRSIIYAYVNVMLIWCIFVILGRHHKLLALFAFAIVILIIRRYWFYDTIWAHCWWLCRFVLAGSC